VTSYCLSSERIFVNSSILGWQKSTSRKTVHWKSNLSASQLFVCYCVILNIEDLLTFLPPQVVGQQLASNSLVGLWQLTSSTWELLELEDWKPNKLWALFLHKWSKENTTSSIVVTSFWVKLIPSWMGHKVGMVGLIIASFWTIPPTQWLKSSRQN